MYLDIIGLAWLAALDNLLRYANIIKVEGSGEPHGFTRHQNPIVRISEKKSVRAEKEKEAFGFYLSTHPIAEIREAIDPQRRIF